MLNYSDSIRKKISKNQIGNNHPCTREKYMHEMHGEVSS